jgi:predicted dehydrogenase
MSEINVALIGQGFMGRTHSNAWGQVAKFFDAPIKSTMHTVCGLAEENPRIFADNWGWRNASTDWESVVRSPEIGLVDIVTPNFMHSPPAQAAIAAGKAVACEKPIAGTLAESREMAQAAQKAGVKTAVWFCYRRVPAVALAHQLVKDGLIGEIRHVRAQYLQDWADESVPLTWRFDKELSGSGAHGDLNAHIIDMARFITGDEIAEINGAIAKTFIKERDIVDAVGAGAGKIAGQKGGKKKGRSDVDDAVLFLATFKRGAVASFESTRLSAGNQNRNTIEINGSKGSIRFDFEDMNILHYHEGMETTQTSGWTRIMCTAGEHHPYVGNWWPDAHLIGYEHGFTNMASDIMRVLAGRKPVVPLPDFADAYETQRVLEAAMIAAKERCAVKLSAVK